jgi:hypothetical protein
MRATILLFAVLIIALDAFTQSAGFPDVNFGNRGEYRFGKSNPIFNENMRLGQIGALSDGTLIAPFYRDSSFTKGIIALDPQGQALGIFGNNGLIENIDNGFINANPGEIHIQHGDRIIFISPRSDTSGTQYSIRRYLANGQLDNSFGNNGIFEFSYNEIPTSNQNRVIIREGLGQDFIVYDKYSIWYFSENGNLNQNFGNAGKMTIGGDTLAYEDIYFVNITSDSSIILNRRVSGVFESWEWVSKINFQGETDSTFGNNGVVDLFPFFTGIEEIKVFYDSVLITGAKSSPFDPFVSDMTLTRLDLDGNFAAFLNDSILSFTVSSTSNIGTDIFVDSLRRIYIGGVSNLPSTYRYTMWRLNSSGMLDFGFGSGGVSRPNTQTWNNVFLPSITYSNNDRIILYSRVGDGNPNTVGVLKLMTEFVSGIETFDEGGIQIFPNPSSDYLQLDLGDLHIDELSIRIFNNQGLEMGSELVEQNESIIDISMLKSGMYLLRIETANKLLTGKFIKE